LQGVAIPCQMRGALRGEAMKIACLAGGLLLASTIAHAEDMAALISQYRHEHGLTAVKIDPQLTAVAERQAHAMAASGIMEHDVAGPFASRIADAHTDSAGENIAAGTKTWSDTLRLWKSSPGHNANLLLAGADSLGVAVARNDQTRYKVFWAMVIGHKESKDPSRPRRPVTEVATTVPTPNFEWLGNLLANGRRLILGQ
jgi:hypothetical protein